jgi:hypothetical protein
VTVRYRSVLAAALGLWLAQLLPQQAAGQGSASRSADTSANQQLADRIVTQLRQSPLLQRYHIEVVVEEGTVDLAGQVSDPAQRDEVLRVVRSLAGVTNVRDRLDVQGDSSVERAAAVQPPLQEPGRLLGPGAPPAGNGSAGPPAPPGAHQEPYPIFHAPPGLAAAAMNPPPLPPYAWPTFAPYNNYSRVAAPTVYPPQAFPFIGPFYPFPKVPLGWRKVQLEWVDGHWWYGRRASGHDWWRIRPW